MSDLLASLHSSTQFSSYREADRLERRLADLKNAGEIEEIAVDWPQHPLLEEHWYRERSTSVVYRYCPPEFPSRGVWERIR